MTRFMMIPLLASALLWLDNSASTDGGGIYSFSGTSTVSFDSSPVQGNQPNVRQRPRLLRQGSRT